MKSLAALILAVLLAGGLGWLFFQKPEGLSASNAQGTRALSPGSEAGGRDATASDLDRGAAGAGAAAAAAQRPALASDPAEGVAAAASDRGIGSEWLERNQAGIAALEHGDLALAVGLFEGCVEAHPEEPVFARNLAIALDALARKRQESDRPEDRAVSLELLARAIELYPGEAQEDRDVRQGLDLRLSRWRASGEAEADFLDDGHIHFQLSYDGDSPGLRQSAPWILEQLEEAYLEFGEHFARFPVEEGRGRIRVVLMERTQFDAATGLGDWAGGAFDGTVRIPVDQLMNQSTRQRLAKTLRHELLHAFVRSVGGLRVPGWLNEGLAQRLELDSPGQRALALQVARARLSEGSLFPLAKLEGSLASWEDPADIGRAYAQSFAFVDYVERQYGLREVIEMILACGLESTPAKAAQRRLGLDLDVILEDFGQSLSR